MNFSGNFKVNFLTKEFSGSILVPAAPKVLEWPFCLKALLRIIPDLTIPEAVNHDRIYVWKSYKNKFFNILGISTLLASPILFILKIYRLLLGLLGYEYRMQINNLRVISNSFAIPNLDPDPLSLWLHQNVGGSYEFLNSKLSEKNVSYDS